MSKPYKDLKPAKYFPVSEKPLSMSPGINHFGTDFGNGERDLLYFQRDAQFSIYIETKKQVETDRHWAFFENDQHKLLHQKAINWILKKQEVELAIKPSEVHLETANSQVNLLETYTELSFNVQEDIALIADQPASLIMGNISMPSFWAPQRIKGANFWQIHQPVPTFPRDEITGNRLVSLISSKGPYVRFVWTVANDDRLDHHPDKGRTSWQEDQKLYLRVERQVTIPFEGLGALFLIRTYLYSFSELTQTELNILKTAIKSMPENIARYKGLWDGKDVIVDQINQLNGLAG